MTTVLDDLKSAFRRSDNGLVKLILINVIVFVAFKLVFVLMWLLSLAPFYETIASQMRMPANLLSLAMRPWSVITTMFFHEDFFHIIFNMMFFFWFGQIIEEYLGSRRLVSLYVLGGLAGGFLYVTAYNLIPNFDRLVHNAELLGASGAIYAVVVGAATLVPNYTFNLIFIGPVRIVYIATFYVFLSFVNITGGNPGGNLAHLGGAILGYIFIRQLQNGNDLGKPVSYVINTVSGWFKRKSPIRMTYSNKKMKKDTFVSYKPEQDEIDAILDKINQSGYESLSKEEKQKLFSASQKD